MPRSSSCAESGVPWVSASHAYHSLMMSLLILIAFVWRTLRGTLAVVHDIYATFLHDEPADYDSICLAHFAGHTGFGA